MSLNLLSLLGTGVGAFFGGPAGAAIGGSIGGAIGGNAGQGVSTGLSGAGILGLLGGNKNASNAPTGIYSGAGTPWDLGAIYKQYGGPGGTPTSNATPNYGRIGSLLSGLAQRTTPPQIHPYQSQHSQPVAQINQNQLMNIPLQAQQVAQDFETWARSLYGPDWRASHPEATLRQLYESLHSNS